MRLQTAPHGLHELGIAALVRRRPEQQQTKSTEPKWHNCGRYYQSLSAALAAVYELSLREDDGCSADLKQALDRADEIKRELMEATVDLRKVE